MKGERQLLTLPWPECPAIEQLPPAKKNNYSKFFFHRVSVQLHTPGSEPVLGITVFNMGGAPLRRYWISRTQHGMQCYYDEKQKYGPERETGRMYSASIDREMQIGGYYSTEDILYSTAAEEALILEFTQSEQKNIGRALRDFCKSQREAANAVRHERKRNEMREWFSLLPPIPEEEKRWEREVLTDGDRYFFYEYTGRKAQHGWCSHCGAESELENIRQGKKGECPKCGSRVEYKSLKWLRKPREAWHRANLLQRADKYVVSRHFRVCIKHELREGVPQTQISRSEYSRQFYNELGDSEACFSRSSGTHAVLVDGFHEDACEEPAVISEAGLEDVRKSAGLRAPLERLAERGLMFGRWPQIAKESRRPEIEYLIKLGLYRLCHDELSTEYGYRSRLFKGKKAEEVLGMPREEIEKHRRADPDGDTFEVCRQLYKSGFTLKVEDIQQIDRLNISQKYITTLWEMARMRSLKRALNYLEKQGVPLGDHWLMEWRDYMSMAEKIGWNIRDEQIAFPKKLHRAHDEAMKALKIKEDAETERRISQLGKALSGLSWSFDGLSIFPARSQAELISEGQAMSHCVGRGMYARKMAEGKTAIFFIRRTKEAETPYVTLELNLRTKKVAQCYGKGDKYPGDKVKNFYLRWEQEIVSRFFKTEKGIKTA